MRQGTLDQPVLVALDRVRKAAASQGWLLSHGGLPNAPLEPMAFRRGFGSFSPATGLGVQLAELDANRTAVAVTVWRGATAGGGYDADRLLRAIGAVTS